MSNMNDRVDEREKTVLDFINTKKNEIKKSEQNKALMNTPAYKLNVLNSEKRKATGDCMDTLLAKLYQDALPFEDPKKNCCLDDMKDEIHTFIDNRSNGKGTEWYIREALAKTKSPLLQKVVNESVAYVNEFYMEKAKDIGTINVADLNFNLNADQARLDKISKKLELDQVADIIHSNVQQAIEDETDKAQKEDDYNQQIEDELADDVEVQDETSMESALAKKTIIGQPTIYQPSLFEGVLLHSARKNKDSEGVEIFTEAVHEYTKLNLIKSLRLEKFDLNTTRNLANEYARS